MFIHVQLVRVNGLMLAFSEASHEEYGGIGPWPVQMSGWQELELELESSGIFTLLKWGRQIMSWNLNLHANPSQCDCLT